MTKKILSIVLSVAVLISVLAAGVYADTEKLTFIDVDASTEEGAAIYKLAENGIVNGNGDGTFTPQRGVTRAELCKMVNNIWKLTTPATEGFSDVTPDLWYYNHVLIGKQAGYIRGFEDGTFRGQSMVTREQASAIICRVAKLSDLKYNGTISDAVSAWAKADVEKILAHGYLQIEAGNAFRATENMTRGELAKALAKFISSSTSSPNTGSADSTGTGSTGDSTGGSTGDSSGDSTGDSTGGSTGDSTGGSTGDSSGDSTGDSTGGSTGDSTGGSTGDSTGGSTGDSTGGSTGDSTGGDSDTNIDYEPQNRAIVTNLSTITDELELKMQLLGDAENEVLGIVVRVIKDVISKKHEFLITPDSVKAKYEEDILNATLLYGQLEPSIKGSLESEITRLNPTAFDFVCDFFGVDFSDLSNF